MASAAHQNDGCSLAAPPMSLSSSKSSYVDDMWSNRPSRRGSDASSIEPELEPLSKPRPDKPDSRPLAATAAPSQHHQSCPPSPAPAGGVPMAASASDGNLSARARPIPPLVHTDDALRRVYPKPAREVDVREALAREPQKWSLGHWRKNARDLPVPPSSVPFTPASTKRFESTKDELRRAHAEMAAQRKPAPKETESSPPSAPETAQKAERAETSKTPVLSLHHMMEGYLEL